MLIDAVSEMHREYRFLFGDGPEGDSTTGGDQGKTGMIKEKGKSGGFWFHPAHFMSPPSSSGWHGDAKRTRYPHRLGSAARPP